MISRVAENCFWLNRYIERAESAARLSSVNHFLVLDANLHQAERWKPMIVITGEQSRFEELLGTEAYDDDEKSEEYLTWSDHNPVSIRTSLYWARENARRTREVISREMWEAVNTGWQWLMSPPARKEYKKDRAQFYQRVRSVCAEFQGVCHNTMLHEEPFDFMRLGMLLERANQTARLMDVKHHWLSRDGQADVETPHESAQWFGLLRLSAAVEPFFKRNQSAPTGRLVTEFLLKNREFPRAVRHCLDRALNFVERIEKTTRRERHCPSWVQLTELSTRLQEANVTQILQHAFGLHEELTHVIDTIGHLGNQLYEDFFDPETITVSG